MDEPVTASISAERVDRDNRDNRSTSPSVKKGLSPQKRVAILLLSVFGLIVLFFFATVFTAKYTKKWKSTLWLLNGDQAFSYRSLLLGMLSAMAFGFIDNAGLFFGIPSYAIADGYAIATARTVEITIACSAVNFFALAVAVFAGLAVEKKYSLRSALWLLPGAYLLTLLANAARIISTQYTDAMAAAWLPDVLHAGMHALAGALIFMFSLAIGYYAIWRCINEYEKNKASA
jgi:exosortase/archaeosortase family protein